MDGILNRYNLKSTGRIYTIGVLKCSRAVEGVTLEKSPPPQHVHMTHHRREHPPSSQGHPLAVPVSTTSASAV